VIITAGKQYKQIGSDVLAPKGDIGITAKTVDIQEARETNKQSTEQKFEQSGVTLAVTSTVISALENAQSQVKATTQTSDDRMKALGAASAAANMKMAADALKAGQGDEHGMVKTGAEGADGSPEVAQANAADKAGGIQVSLSYGQSSSQSNSSTATDTARGSTVKSGGITSIKATGDGQNSNLTIQGSDVSGNQVNLEADNKVSLLAAQNTTTQTSSNSNSSASVGVAAQLGNQGGGIGVTGSVSKGSGNGNGTETTYTNTHVVGANRVTIKSGGDTTFKGAVVEGNQVTANIGGNLNIESLQDTATYAEKNSQVGASAMVGAGGSGNVNYAKSSIFSNYASVTEQSGIKAGDGGFTVNVQGNTDLQGGAITSTQAAIDQNKNSFQTGGHLTTSDIQNKASYEAKSVSVSLGAGGSPMPGQGLSSTLSGAGMGKDSGSTSSTTTAAISGIAGDTAKRTGDNAQGIGKIFDADKVRQEIQAQTKITQEFAKQASTAVASYSDQQKKDLQTQINDKKTSDTDKAVLKDQLNQVLLEEKVLNILVGAVTGFGETMVTKESLKVAAEQMREAMIEDSTTFKGVVDSKGNVLNNNKAGLSEGINGDGVKLGGTRVDLDKLCGVSNERCIKNTDGSLALNDKGQVQFDDKAAGMSLSAFLESPQGKEMSGPTGGVQGAVGTLFGEPYKAGSWQDKLIEAFAGSHDVIGGKLSGLYDKQGNAERDRSPVTNAAQEAWSASGAIVGALPFAAAQGLPPEVWKAIGVLLKGGI
jgi:filamentous hemagglutinin